MPGRIYCRFAEGSLELQELGKLIREKTNHDREPYFAVRSGSKKPPETHMLDPAFIHDMTRGKFAAPLLTIEIENKLSETEMHFSLTPEYNYPISGFPRCLIDDEKIQTSESCDITLVFTRHAKILQGQCIQSPSMLVDGRAVRASGNRAVASGDHPTGMPLIWDERLRTTQMLRMYLGMPQLSSFDEALRISRRPETQVELISKDCR